jgi:hypothetical protein
MELVITPEAARRRVTVRRRARIVVARFTGRRVIDDNRLPSTPTAEGIADRRSEQEREPGGTEAALAILAIDGDRLVLPQVQDRVTARWHL